MLFLTSAISDKLVADSIRAGGSGYLLKEVNGQSLIQAVLDVAAGGKAHDPAVSAHLLEVARQGTSRTTTYQRPRSKPAGFAHGR